ncbi:ATP-binding protein [Echinicola shivajiensis]|uniref:ATP-binding protein n=1 Tax=Echinicola shivajiensis TaxID=1035916 RepID=UPI001BFC5762|nr:ATP-binding protein [Echinicola shivajiensis]
MDDIFNGRSEVRNRVLANVFKELGLIEQWGSGINRIINTCKSYGLQSPTIQEKNDYFDIEFIRPQITISSKESIEQNQPIRQNHERLRTITNDYERLEKEKQTILLYLLEKGKISRKEATALLDLKNTKTYEILTEMVDQDLIKKQGKGRATYYKL